MEFEDIAKVTEGQEKFCEKLGLNVSGDTVALASAKIEELVQKEFWGGGLVSPSEKQIELAAKYRIDISNMSRIVGGAIVNDILQQLNFTQIKKENLKSGASVRKAYEEDGRIWVISSIDDEGVVYFKGGDGQRACARNLVRV